MLTARAITSAAFQPDCQAADDISNDLGTAEEASLREALTVIRTGACSAPRSTSQSLRVAAPAFKATGWQSVVNAH